MQTQPLEPRIESSLLYTREDGMQAFVHDSHRDYFLAKYLAPNRLGKENQLTYYWFVRPELLQATPFYVGMVTDANEMLLQIVHYKKFQLLAQSSNETKAVSESTVVSIISQLFNDLSIYDGGLIANAILTVSKKGKKRLEDYAIEILKDPQLTHYKLGLVYRHKWELTQKALIEFEECLKYTIKTSRLSAECMYELGKLYRFTKPRRANQYLKRAMALYKGLDGEDIRTEEAHVAFDAATELKNYSKDYSSAKKLFERSIELFEKFAKESDFLKGYYISKTCLCYKELGKMQRKQRLRKKYK